MPAPQRLWLDSLRRAFGAKDEAEREVHLAEMENAMPDDGGGSGSEGDDANHHHVTVNIGGIETPKPKDAEAGGEGQANEGDEMDEDKVNEIVGAAVAKALEPVTTALQAITTKLEQMATKTDETSDKVAAVVEALDDMSDPEDVATQDAIARAEILAPGLTLPTTDSAPGSKPHRDAMGGFQRAALRHALTTDAGRSAIGSVLGHVRPDLIARMPLNEVAVAFRGASQLMIDRNAVQTVGTLASATAGYVRDEKGHRVRPMNTADLAEIHRKFYETRRA